MTAEFTIPTRLPGMNEYTDACRRHAQVGAKMKHNNQEIAAWAIKTQLRGVTFDKPVEITYTFFEPNRRRDKSNVAAFGIKVIEDALVMCGVLKDDGWAYIQAFTSRFMLDREKPRIVVQITDEGAE